MELWIRSQDKSMLQKIDALFTSKDIREDSCRVCTDNMRYETITLGTYAAEERALEILDEIQHKLANTNYDCLIDDYKIKASEIVYEMPKE